MVDTTAPATWRCRECRDRGIKTPPALLVGVVKPGRLEDVRRVPSVRLGKRETERDMAREAGFVPTSWGSYNRTGFEMLDAEPFTNTCVCGHEVSVSSQELLDTLLEQRRLTAFI